MSAALPASGTPRATPLLAALVFVAFLDNFAQFPVLAPLATSLGAGPLMAGVILGGYSLTNLMGNLAVGPVLDRRGPFLPLATSLLLTAGVLGSYALARSPGALLALRLAHGFTAAAIVPAVFTLAASGRGAGARPDHGDGDGTGTLGRMRILGITIGSAAVVAPPLAGILAARHGFGAVYVSLGALFAVAGFVALIGAPRVPGHPGPGPSKGRPNGRPEPVGRLLGAGSRGGPLPAWLGAGALVFGVGSVALLLPLGLAAEGREPAARVAGQLLGLFSFAAVGSMALVGRARKGSGVPDLLTLAGRGLLLMAAALLLLLAFRGPPAQVAGMLLLGWGFGTAFPTLSAAVGERTAPERRGTGYALFYAAFSAGALAGPIAAGAAAAFASRLALGYGPAIVLAALVGSFLVSVPERARTGPQP